MSNNCRRIQVVSEEILAHWASVRPARRHQWVKTGTQASWAYIATYKQTNKELLQIYLYIPAACMMPPPAPILILTIQKHQSCQWQLSPTTTTKMTTTIVCAWNSQWQTSRFAIDNWMKEISTRYNWFALCSRLQCVVIQAIQPHKPWSHDLQKHGNRYKCQFHINLRIDSMVTLTHRSVFNQWCHSVTPIYELDSLYSTWIACTFVPTSRILVDAPLSPVGTSRYILDTGLS